jgi:Fe-S cluster assembly scaffold protein SufB
MKFIPLIPSEASIICHGQETVVRIPNGAMIEPPIDLVLFSSNRDLPVSLKIYAGEWAMATIVVRLENETPNKHLEFKQTVIAKEGADVKIVEYQNLPADTIFRATRETKAKQRAQVDHVIVQMGGLRTENRLSLVSEHSHCTLNSNILICARGQQKHQFILNNKFVHKEGKGEAKVSSIAMGEGVIDIQGTIKVGAKAKGTESHLHLDSLLLSRTASITAIPALEINTNDVKVGHGASVSNLNEENLFYLTSRGLDPDEARKLMVKGFVAGITDRLLDAPEMRDEILTMI